MFLFFFVFSFTKTEINLGKTKLHVKICDVLLNQFLKKEIFLFSKKKKKKRSITFNFFSN